MGECRLYAINDIFIERFTQSECFGAVIELSTLKFADNMSWMKNYSIIAMVGIYLL